MSLSESSGDVSTDLRTGCLVGAFVGLGIAGNSGIQPEISYVQKGASRKAVDPGTFETLTETTKLDYIELQVPVDIDIQIENRDITPRLYAGPTFGLALSCEVETEGAAGPPVDCKDNVKSYDLGLLVGLGVQLGAGPGAIVADLRYDLGILNVNEGSATQRNRSIQVLLGYQRDI